MGMFKKSVTVSNLFHMDKRFQADFWVDTGANHVQYSKASDEPRARIMAHPAWVPARSANIYSFVPEDFLEEIHVEPTGKRNLILADGRTDTRLFGTCNFEIDGIEGAVPCPIIFAPKASLFLLGATALENFGVGVDPISRDLKPILAVIGGFLASGKAN
uniref:Aspartyl protease n=1 Tax=Candidatus Kentrum sp. UNK TaxID=2126344 RepID=A0A451A088_9GAMM|nr:MAG: hypothetical protein BECKUNK1418G_GA0071005_100721 [Candidatus Kentron sp. UNK]VFK68726.1 MAG: hypothetical protein BECKUNK1418H_GA0071006_100531 [Candidatus Kentron sp. UNK]